MLGERLEAAVEHGDWRAVVGLLEAPRSDADGRELRAWYRSRRADWTRRAEGQGQVVGSRKGYWPCLRILAVDLAPGPAKAARWSGLTTWSRFEVDAALAAAVERIALRGSDYAAQFLGEAATLPFPGEGEARAARVAEYGLPLIAHFGLPPPSSPGFALGWAWYYAQRAQRARWAEYYRDQRRGQGEPDPEPETLSRIVVDRRGKARVESREVSACTLVDLLREDPVVADAVGAALARPGTLAVLAEGPSSDWAFAPALGKLLAEGRLERAPVLEGCLTALTRQEPPKAQKAIAKILAALQISAADLAGQVPLAQSLMATSTGQVTAVLLPALLDAVATPEEVTELATTVFSRSEKAQQAVLLKALTAKDASRRFGAAGAAGGLQVAARVEDESTASRAGTALEALGVEAERPEPAAMDGLWADLPSAPAAVPASPIPADEAAITAAVSAHSVAQHPAGEALVADAIIRWARADRREAMRWAAAVADEPWRFPRPVSAARSWATGRLSRGDYDQFAQLVVALHDGPKHPGVDHWAVSSLPLAEVLARLLDYETFLRAGTIPFLLSTPTHLDGSLSFTALVERLRRYGEQTAYGPVDLFQALLRLEPVAPERARELDGLALRPWGREQGLAARLLPGRQGRSLEDGVDIVRRWVAGGGLPSLHTTRGEELEVDPVTLPVPLDAFPGIPGGMVAGHVSATHQPYHGWALTTATVAGVLPQWPELTVAKLQREFDQKARPVVRWLPLLAQSPGTPGLGVHHAVATTLSHADEDCRLIAVEAARTLMARRVWRQELFTDACLTLLDDGRLRLARTASAWEQLVLAGGLKELWPTMVAVVDSACEQDRKPAGLSDLLAMTRRYAAAVPGVQASKGVLALASARGSSKAQVEARALVADIAALDRGGR